RMTGVENNRQVAELVEDRDGGNVTGVAGGGFKSADAALAEQYIRIAVRDQVFGGHEQLLDGRAEAALEQHRAAAAAERLEQGEVLHVARADLHDVGVIG